jgi:hypothetical protein
VLSSTQKRLFLMHDLGSSIVAYYHFPALLCRQLLKEIPDPFPHALTEHAWGKAIMVAELRYNRFVFYDGRRLHQQYMLPEDAPRMSTDPSKGRLTMNSFFWNGPDQKG